MQINCWKANRFIDITLNNTHVILYRIRLM